MKGVDVGVDVEVDDRVNVRVDDDKCSDSRVEHRVGNRLEDNSAERTSANGFEVGSVTVAAASAALGSTAGVGNGPPCGSAASPAGYMQNNNPQLAITVSTDKLIIV